MTNKNIKNIFLNETQKTDYKGIVFHFMRIWKKKRKKERKIDTKRRSSISHMWISKNTYPLREKAQLYRQIYLFYYINNVIYIYLYLYQINLFISVNSITSRKK